MTAIYPSKQPKKRADHFWRARAAAAARSHIRQIREHRHSLEVLRIRIENRCQDADRAIDKLNEVIADLTGMPHE